MVYLGPFPNLLCSLMDWKKAWTHCFCVFLAVIWVLFDYLYLSLRLRIGQIMEDFFEVLHQT